MSKWRLLLEDIRYKFKWQNLGLCELQLVQFLIKADVFSNFKSKIAIKTIKELHRRGKLII